jgi:hypothetical protein
MHIIRHWVRLCAIVVLSGGLVAARAQDDDKPSTGSNQPLVQIRSVSKVFTAKGSPAYLISYVYDFGKLPSILYKGARYCPLLR